MRRIALPAIALLIFAGGCVSATKHKEELARSARLEEEKSGLESTGAALRAEVKGLQEQLGALKEAKTELKGKHDYATTKLADTEQSLEKTEKSLSELRAELTGEKEKGRELLGQHEFTKAQLSDTQGKVVMMQGRLKSLRRAFTDYKKIRDSERAELKVKWDSVQQNFQTLDARLKEVSTLYVEIAGKLAALQAPENPELQSGEAALAAEQTRAEMEGETDEPAAAAVKTEAPAVKTEAPAVKTETLAVEIETPAPQADVPAAPDKESAD
ncbi:MAG: hypothetical protein ABIJ96_07715 [Elusimicrobiota bacterium]